MTMIRKANVIKSGENSNQITRPLQLSPQSNNHTLGKKHTSMGYLERRTRSLTNTMSSRLVTACKRKAMSKCSTTDLISSMANFCPMQFRRPVNIERETGELFPGPTLNDHFILIHPLKRE